MEEEEEEEQDVWTVQTSVQRLSLSVKEKRK